MSATIIRIELEGPFEMRNGLDEILPCVVSITSPTFEKGIIGVLSAIHRRCEEQESNELEPGDRRLE